MQLREQNADGGIIITASHNPAEWNALKLLNEKGEFLSSEDGMRVLEIAAREDFNFVSVDSTGSLEYDDTWGKKHIDQILGLNLVSCKRDKSCRIYSCNRLYQLSGRYNTSSVAKVTRSRKNN